MDETSAIERESDSSSDSDSDVEDNVVRDEDNANNEDNPLTLTDDNQTSYLVIPDFEGEKDRPEYPEEPGECEAEKSSAPISKPESEVAPTTAEISAEGDKQKKKRKRKKLLSICLTACKYESVRRAARRYGFKEVGDEEDWNLFWTDFSVSLERVMDMKRYQKINHFPGMSELCRKDLLARNMNRMLKLFPKDYNVFPRSWCLPADHGDFLAYTRQKKNKTYILKPESGCQGRGIWLTKNPKDIKPHEHMLCQQYLSKPFLIDGFKFDLRIYALVTSCDPLRIFVFREGLGRFATAKYIPPTATNCSNVYMHLTNYAINKNSNDFIRDEESGSKRRLCTINNWLEDNDYDVERLWKEIDDVIIKTLISAHAVLKHNYRTCFPNHVLGSGCFEILGFDIVLDKKLRPFVLEVNHSPSFTTDAAIDREIKDVLLYDTLNIVNFGAADRRKCIEEDRRKIKERLLCRLDKKEVKEDLDRAQLKWMEDQTRYEDTHMGNYRRIYPAEGTEKYDKYFHNSGSLYQETAAFKARSECARQQREEISKKQEKLESMLNKKKKDATLMRPESPGERSRGRAKARKPVLSMSQRNDNDTPERNKYNGGKKYRVHYTMGNSKLGPSVDPLASSRESNQMQVDSSKPQDIVDVEETERLACLVQRDNLVRGLGIIDHVYKLLQSIPNSNVSPPKPDSKHISFAVDAITSGVNDVYLHPHGMQNISYQALNSLSGGQSTQPYGTRNLYQSSNNSTTTAQRNDAQWKSLQNLHRTGNGNVLGQVHNRSRFGSRNVNDSDPIMIANDFAKVIPGGKSLHIQSMPAYASDYDQQQQLPNIRRRPVGAPSNFSLSLISGPAPFILRPEISSANSSPAARTGGQQGASSNADRANGFRGQRNAGRTLRGNSTGVLNL